MENIYIAHHEKNKKEANEIHKRLQEDDQSPFLRETLKAGLRQDDIGKYIDKARFSIVLISGYTEKDDGSYFWKEFNLIVERSKSFRKGSVFIIPIKLGDVSLPYEIKGIKHIDFGHENWYKELQVSIARKTSNTDYSNERVQEIKKNSKGAYDDCVSFFTAYDKTGMEEPSIEYFYAAGLFAFHKKDYDLAASLLLYVKSKNLIDSELFSKLGACYVKLGRLVEAITALDDGIKKDIEEDEKYPTSFYNRGIAYTLKEEYAKAEEDYKEAIKLKEDYYQAVVNLLDF